MAEANSRTRPPRLGPRWKARSITDSAFQTGCESAARQIQSHTGGEIRRIRPIAIQGTNPETLFLGAYRGHNTGWHYHEVVVKADRVYDAFTGYQGLPVEEYKALWELRDAIHFGF